MATGFPDWANAHLLPSFRGRVFRVEGVGSDAVAISGPSIGQRLKQGDWPILLQTTGKRPFVVRGEKKRPRVEKRVRPGC